MECINWHAQELDFLKYYYMFLACRHSFTTCGSGLERVSEKSYLLLTSSSTAREFNVMSVVVDSDRGTALLPGTENAAVAAARQSTKRDSDSICIFNFWYFSDLIQKVQYPCVLLKN